MLKCLKSDILGAKFVKLYIQPKPFSLHFFSKSRSL